MTHPLRWIAPCAVALALAAPVRAQLPGPAPRDTTPVELPEIVVIGSIVPAMGPAVGSGIPARVEILERADLRAAEPRLLGDALASRTGISLYDDLGSPFKTTLVTRGFAAGPVVGLPQGVTVFLDGVPVNEPDAGQVNFDLLPLDHVERIEVLGGTASLLGPNALGGAVNLVTRHGGTGAEAEASVGSFGARSAGASVGGGLGTGWSYYAGGTWAGEEGWRQRTESRLGQGLASLSWGGRHSGARLQVLGAASRAETAGSLPLSVYTVQPDSNLTAGDFEALGQLHVAASGYTRVGAGRGSATAYLRRHRAERFNVNQAVDPDVRSFSRNRTLGVSADWRVARRAAPGTLGLRLGTGAALHGTSIRILAERIDPRLTTDVRSPIRETHAYGIADLVAGRLTMSGGVRLDAVQIPFRNRLNPARDTTSRYVRASPRLGAGLDLGRGVSAYASAGQSFRPPAVIELACADPLEPCPLPFALGDDPPLDPVIATTYEAGARWSTGPATVGVSAYRTAVRDEIFLLPYEEEGEPEGSTLDGYFANVAATRRAGVELSSRVRLPGGHRFHLSYAHTRATFRTGDVELFSIREAAGGENEVEAGDHLPLVPDHAVALGATLRLPVGLHLGGEAQYVGERWRRGDEANQEAPLEPYLVANGRLSAASRGWEVEASVLNLFGSRYATYGTFNLNRGAGGRLEGFLTPGRPRSLALTLRRRASSGAAAPDRDP
jgi:outer membrane receptor protein involved in Fe transport